MVQSIDLLWFEDINPFNEPVFDFPVLGKLSMRQLLLLGIGTIISYAIYQSTNDAIYSILPVSIMAFIALKKQNVLSTEKMLLSIIMFALKGSISYSETTSARKSRLALRTKGKKAVTEKSDRLQLAREFSRQVGHGAKPIDVNTRDLMKPVRIKMKLLLSSGEILANRMAKVYFGEEYVASLSSDVNGELEVLIIPRQEGERRLKVYAEGFSEPVLDESVMVRKA